MSDKILVDGECKYCEGRRSETECLACGGIYGRYTREQALKLAVDEIMACSRLKLLCEEGNTLCDGNFYPAETTDEVMEKLK